MNAAPSAVPSAHSATTGHFDPEQYLLGILQRLTSTKQSAVIEAPGGVLCVMPELGEYAVTLGQEELRKFCRHSIDQYVVKKLTEPPQRWLAETRAPRRNLDELMWEAALAVANGRLLKGCKNDDVVVLKFWPNLTRIGLTPNTVRIAALLTRYPTSVSLAYRLLKIPQGEVNDFYSAARCAGLAVAVNRRPEAEQPPIKAHRQRNLFSLIMQRLSAPKGAP